VLTDWHEGMATGNEEIDEQHKELLSHVGDLLKGARASRGSEEIGKLMWFLKRYVRKHFRDEEKLQLESGFPGYQEHKTQHESFFLEVRRLESIHTEHGADTIMIVAAVQSMCDWLRTHFNRMDKIMVDYLREKSANDANK